MKTFLVISLLLLSIQCIGQRKAKLQFHIMTEAESRAVKYIYKDPAGRYHYHTNGKDSIVSKAAARKIVAQWRYDAVPKRSI